MNMMVKEKVGRIASDLRDYIYPESFRPEKIYAKMYDQDHPEIENDYILFGENDHWGGFDKHCIFTFEAVMPENFDKKPVVFTITDGIEGQFLLYVNDKISQGMDSCHLDALITESARAGEKYSIKVVSYCPEEKLLTFNCVLRTVSREVEKLYYDMIVPYEVASLLDEEDSRRTEILKRLAEAVDMLDLRKPYSESFYASVNKALEYMEGFYNNFCSPGEDSVLCVGHTHIDVAWLWRLRQTREKVGRSFATVLALMEQYPDYYFTQSQPQLYEYAGIDYPELYEKIKQRVREGRWEPEGAMWLEADCNVTGGESLVRQILFGKRFFKKEFNVDNKVLWLPDVFGYSAALPQILKKSGVDYFCTSKISWNEYNTMPYDTFMWQGMDGTQILTHFHTARNYKENCRGATYNSWLNPTTIMGAHWSYRQKDINTQAMISYGHGDGGGGPTAPMLEYSKRLEKGIPGCPVAVKGKIIDFFRRLEKAAAGSKYLPKWVGELYLEYHRGTYTSIARNKKYNRKSENLYMETETFNVINNLLLNAQYPQDEINSGWKTILLNQFHDILPGSSIREVYE
ncbi:MAG TPA: alpha-mannosidase, partial [Clostridia bacterium]|nr:alpha-mannosidase [Clostridia bacterium]